MNYIEQLKNIQAEAQNLSLSKVEVRNEVLRKIAAKLISEQKQILAANEIDLESVPADYSKALRDRLTLTPARLQQMKASLLEVADLPNPLMKILSKKQLKNGLILRQMTSPIGVILMIFESRPNVVTEAFSMAFKTGNAFIMKGGKESLHTARVLYDIIEESISEAGLNPAVFWGVDSTDRELVQQLMKENKYINLVIPRGGEKLIEFVVNHSRIPIIKNDRGLVHVYVDSKANLKMAEEIVFNAKTQRPSVCNAMETLLVHQDIAEKFLPKAFQSLSSKNVEWYCCDKSYSILQSSIAGKNQKASQTEMIHHAEKGQYDIEYGDFKISCRVVESAEQALEHIAEHGSKHSEVIVTEDRALARTFQRMVDAACVYWNASSRFTDGYEFGLGGEIGVSTQKLHVRGPIGLSALTSVRWIIDGNGQVRN
jgi:glutamate-5-semialdehyde dehydrogenase